MEVASTPTARTTSAPPTAPEGRRQALVVVVVAWAVTRLLQMLLTTGVLPYPWHWVTTDVGQYYQGWYQVLATGVFPMDDVSWQYPPGAAAVMLAPALLPFDYSLSFYLLTLVADGAVLAMLVSVAAGSKQAPRMRFAGAWVWVAAVPLLGPTIYARYDLLVTAVAVAGLLALRHSAGGAGMLLGLGAVLKVWPALALIGTPPGPRTRRAWLAGIGTALGLVAAYVLLMPGALSFLRYQEARGIEVESIWAMPFHIAIHNGWSGHAQMNYGSIEFLGPYIDVVSRLALLSTVVATVWVVAWRLTARRWTSATPFDAAMAVMLLFVVTSRVISPQYMIWLLGLGAVCLTVRATTQRPVVVLVMVASVLTHWEFPIWFNRVMSEDPAGLTVLFTRNALLIAATLLSCVRLWRGSRGDADGGLPDDLADDLTDADGTDELDEADERDELDVEGDRAGRGGATRLGARADDSSAAPQVQGSA
ncbi:glycosyltransferase family 87 protein [Allostreptomyces psammosilenae]|uniref:DUF2029 domain-containing protein n=1 Tax=Allostreptomyces psammosilenae TaxID=1892865 RepID=A0A853A9F5_9ACTN|nr:glycosyltransferase family 87 protein [Allostreptomyces psammosilenae]NYI07042.1 hypothetical protein [Allostreptomyces psammosilenae]